MAKLEKDKFIESLKEMNIKEIMELVEAMKEEFGIDPSTVAAAPAQAVANDAPTEVTVSLEGAGANKVAVIKAIKEITGLGLMDAKKMVDSAPVAVKENIKPEEAAELKAKLEETGATVKVA